MSIAKGARRSRTLNGVAPGAGPPLALAWPQRETLWLSARCAAAGRLLVVWSLLVAARLAQRCARAPASWTSSRRNCSTMQRLAAESRELRAAAPVLPAQAAAALKAATERLGDSGKITLHGDRASADAQRHASPRACAPGSARRAARHARAPWSCSCSARRRATAAASRSRCRARHETASAANAAAGLPPLAGTGWGESTFAEVAWDKSRGAAGALGAGGVVLRRAGRLSSRLPAAWLAGAVAPATDQRLLLADARGTLWSGSAVAVLTGGPDSRDASALPGRLEWTLAPRGLGLELTRTPRLLPERRDRSCSSSPASAAWR